MARDERLDRGVAVKILPRERVMQGRFEREARAAAKLAHPGIVTLYEAAVDGEGAYLVSELVRGPTLAQLLEAGRLSDRDVVMIGIALCDALAHAHAQGIVHRDVKPSNVLVPEQPAPPAQVAKLTDFGVARVIGGDPLTRAGDVVGTAAYMAPEQAEGREAGASADLYSLAVVLYEALTGMNPVPASTAAQRARRLGAHLPPLRRQRRELPRELGQAIDLALRPRPRERGTVDRLHDALSAAAEAVEDTPGIVTDPWPVRGHRASPGTRGACEETDRSGDEQLGSAITPRPVRWPARGLAAVAAAGVTAWLAAHTVAFPVGPAAAIAMAWLLVVALPRIGWLTLAAAASGSLAAQGRPGGALVIFIAALVPALLMPRAGTMWPLAAVAPALGVLNIAGAWPALAARAGTSWRRAALGITGWIWVVLAAPIANADLYARRPAGTPTAGAWMRSLSETAHHVLAPLLTTGVLAVALVWGAGAAVLPLIRSRGSRARDVGLVTLWSAVTVSTSTALLGAARGTVLDSALAGAIAGAVIALAPTTTNSRHRVGTHVNH